MKGIFKHSFLREYNWLKSNKWDFAMVYCVPLLSVLFVWWLFSAAIPRDLPIGVLDEEHSALSRQISRYLDASPGLRVAQQYSNKREAEADFKAGKVYAVVQLPLGLTENIKQQKKATVVLHDNAQFGTHSGLIQRDVRTTVATISAGIEIVARTKKGASPSQAQNDMTPIKGAMTNLFNVSSNYQRFLAVAMIPALLHILAMTAGVQAVGRELRDRTIPQWLAQKEYWKRTPKMAIFRWALAGKSLPATVSFAVAALVYIILYAQLVDIGILPWLVVYVALLLMLIFSILLGAFLAVLTMSYRLALSGSAFFSAPALAFSGVGFPLLAMSDGARLWANVSVFTHYLRLQIMQIEMYRPIAYCLFSLVLITVIIALLFLACSFMFKKAYLMPERWGAR